MGQDGSMSSLLKSAAILPTLNATVPTIQIQAGTHTITAADPVPDDLRQALDQIHHSTTH
jgi:hypothetical protein